MRELTLIDENILTSLNSLANATKGAIDFLLRRYVRLVVHSYLGYGPALESLLPIERVGDEAASFYQTDTGAPSLSIIQVRKSFYAYGNYYFSHHI